MLPKCTIFLGKRLEKQLIADPAILLYDEEGGLRRLERIPASLQHLVVLAKRVPDVGFATLSDPAFNAVFAGLSSRGVLRGMVRQVALWCRRIECVLDVQPLRGDDFVLELRITFCGKGPKPVEPHCIVRMSVEGKDHSIVWST